MSYFIECSRNLANLSPGIFSVVVVVVITIGMSAVAEEVGPSNQLWSREELVQLAGYGEEKLSTVLVTGTVLCQACFPDHEPPQLRTWPISGALVAVNCPSSGKLSNRNSAKAMTNEYGEFLIDLPSHLHAITNLDERCSVKVVRVPKSSVCRPANYVRKDKALKLSSVGNGIRNYAAGEIEFLHFTSKSLQACTQGATIDKEAPW